MIDLLIRIMADGLVVVVALIGAYGYIKYVRLNDYQRHLRAFMAGLSALTSAKLLSLLYVSAHRPFELLGVTPKAAYLNNPGFPSDHAVFVAVITFVVACATRRWRVALLLAALSVVVGIGRVLALVHTPVDVLGGYFAAAIGVLPWYVGRISVSKHK